MILHNAISLDGRLDGFNLDVGLYYEIAGRLGADAILYGTDYPWDVGLLGRAAEIPGLSRLSKADQEKILSGNARRVYKI